VALGASGSGGGASGSERPRLVVAITGASGTVLGVRLLETLARLGSHEVHLVLSSAGRTTLAYETDRTPADLRALVAAVHHERDMTSALASGSFRTEGMAVVPCSVRTLSAVATSSCDTLVARAADVTLKERRRLVLVVRETPLHLGHLRLMTAATEAGAIVLPPVPAFYHRPANLDDVVDHLVGKILDCFGIDAGLFPRWPSGRPG